MSTERDQQGNEKRDQGPILREATRKAREKALELVNQYETLMNHTKTKQREVKAFLQGAHMPLMSDRLYWSKRAMTLTQYYTLKQVVRWLEARR